MKKTIIIPILLLVIQAFAINPWQKTDFQIFRIEGERKIIPDKYISLRLDIDAFKNAFTKNKDFVLMDIPTPEGKFSTYKVTESMCMEKELADKYPIIKTYTAVCVNNPLVTAKLDFTAKGFHAMVFDEAGTYFIDPYAEKNTNFYTCYYKKDYYVVGKHLDCRGDYTSDALHRWSTTDNTTAIVSDNKRRTLRLALSCTVEYSKAVDGPNPTKEGVLSAMVTSVNRINGIYEKELSIHMNLVANNDTLIFLTSDPFSNFDGFTMLNQNQKVVDNRIKNANYDIGHVFSTGGGGIAGLGVVCVQGIKANGVTGAPNPIGDAYDVDYVAHEMGHQFGANHTFNAGTGSCAGNRNASTAYEIGSGTTIMSYAGICNNNDIAEHSDDYFHRISLKEIMEYISSTSCAQITPSNSIAPQIQDYSSTYYIPYKTNFELPAFASDPDGDAINYCWEQSDLGPQVNWNNTNNTKAPLFRSFLPTANNVRIFPTYNQIINNVIKYRGEVLPELTRDIKFKCTVRENRNGWGQFNAPETTVLLKTVSTPSLFRVTNYVQDTVIKGNSTQAILWDTTTTTLAPISCGRVNIFLSLDSASTFPIQLASNTPNDGIEVVTIPDIFTKDYSARIKIKGVNNVFFDFNDGRIKIEKESPQAPLVDFTITDTVLCAGETLDYTATITNAYDSLKWTISGASPSQSTLSSGTASYSSSGTFSIILTAYKNASAYTKSRTIIVNPQPSIVITPSNPQICKGESLNITAQYLEGVSCIWNTSATSSTLLVSPLENTKYTVEVTDANGCKNKDSITVTVKMPTQSTLTPTICNGDTLYIESQQFTASGVYEVNLINSQGCDSTIQINLQVEAPPNLPIIISINDTLKVNNVSANTYKWYLNGNLKVTTPLPYIVTTERGQWTVVVMTALGCTSSISSPYVITSIKNNTIRNLSIIPNPNKGNFTLEIPSDVENDVSYHIHNILGEQIATGEAKIKKGLNIIPIDVTGNAKGMYILHLRSKDNNFSTTFTID